MFSADLVVNRKFNIASLATWRKSFTLVVVVSLAFDHVRVPSMSENVTKSFFMNYDVFCRFAYIEFADKESVETASALDGTLFRGRQLQVSRGDGKINYWFLCLTGIQFMV